jgi:hypothetical protein
MKARSWLPEVGGDVKIFEGGQRSITLLYLKGHICESLSNLSSSIEGGDSSISVQGRNIF